jgi:hypothetical protein
MVRNRLRLGVEDASNEDVDLARAAVALHGGFPPRAAELTRCLHGRGKLGGVDATA